jgi:hypothetical protein
MSAQCTEFVRVSTAFSGNYLSDQGSSSYSFRDLSCEMSLMHDYFMPIRLAKGGRDRQTLW